MSQHLDSIALYHKLINRKILCEEGLGIKRLRNLIGGSPGAGGGILFTAFMDNTEVVIKIFPVDCPIRYIKGIAKSTVVREIMAIMN